MKVNQNLPSKIRIKLNTPGMILMFMQMCKNQKEVFFRDFR